MSTVATHSFVHRLHSRKAQAGFTIVELLIVIVVIAILAAISVVAYSGVQSRARDSKRASDIATIERAIRAYEVANDGLPITMSYTDTGSSSGWDYSRNPDWLKFLRPQSGNMPVDPQNKTGETGDPGSVGTRQYMYYCYGPGITWAPDPTRSTVTLGYTKDNGTPVRKNFAVSRCI